jgi:hypothetical protein
VSTGLCRGLSRQPQTEWSAVPHEELRKAAKFLVKGTTMFPEKKWGPALLPAPTAPSEGSAGVRNLVPGDPFSILAHQLRRRFPSILMKPGGLPLHRCSAALLGSTTLASRFAHHTPEEVLEPRRATEDRLFRRLFPAGPASTPEGASALPAGGDRTFGHLPRPPAVADYWGGRDRRPDHQVTMHMSPESRKRKMG